MLYFAYASNLSLKRMKEHCPDSRPGYIATLPNYKLVFTGWFREWRGGKATIISSRGEKVRGAVYEVTDACMKKLEKYEPGYTKMDVTVYNEDNEPVSAVTFIKSGRLDESSPSKEYASIIQQGYRDWRLV